MVSRRRRRQGIGKIIVSVESRIRKIEKNPSPKRLKTNVVTTEKLGFRAVTTKTVAADAITPNEAAFGTTIVTDTQPTEYLKEGTTWINPDDGVTNIYSENLNDFITVTDANAVEALSIAQGKNKTYVQNDEPTGGSYSEGDLWIDTNDGNKLYVYSGTAWVARQDAAISTAQSTANGKNTVYYSTSEPGSTANTAGDIWWKYGITRSISNKALTSNVATLTTSTAHGLAVGSTVKISSVDATFNGTFTVTSIPTTTTFTYAKTATNVVSSAVSPAGTLLYSDGIITGQWTGAGGTSWTSTTVGNLVIANIDAGKITTGYLDVAGAVKITTSATASSTGGNTARIEINSSGFYAYDGTVATVSITNAGTAVFSGTVNATGGTFTGYVTAGTARFGAAVQTGKNGIYINATNYWYDDGSFKAGTGTSAITYDGSGTLTIGAGSSIGGTTASTLVSNAAEGATALQDGNGVSKNGSDQITSISTSSGIKIGTRVDGTGARVEMNSTGFYAYDGVSGTPTVQILNTGSATFTGEVKAGSFSGGISSTATITGGTFATASNGTRLEISGGNIYTYDGSEQQGVISSTAGALYFYGPGSSLGAGGKMQLYSDTNSTSSLAGLVSLTAGGTGDVTLSTATNLLRVDGATTAVTLDAATPVATFGLRNIRGYTSFDPATNSSGTDGDIVVVYS